MFSFDQDKVDLNNKIDRGFYGKVCPYKEDPPDFERFVVKVAHTDNFAAFLRYIQEIVLGFSCEHANVLPVRGYYIDYDQRRRLWSIYIKLDRMKCSLKARINEKRRKSENFSQKEIVNSLYEMSCGLEYLHNRKIAHRDIKPANILISKSEELKIADIGSGKFVGDEPSLAPSSVAGTPCYMAPEISERGEAPYLKKRNFFEADIWSLGVVIAEMCLLKLGIVDTRRSGRENEDNIIQGLKQLEGIYDKDLLDLIASLIRSDPTKRKSMQNIQKTLRERFGNYLEVKETTLSDFK